MHWRTDMESKIHGIIFRNYKKISNLTDYEKSVFEKILKCRSEAVPFVFTRCDRCSSVHLVYKSCKDRMCPVCNGAAPVKWTAKRESEMLNTGYFLLTYTVPSQLRGLFLLNKKICCDMLFKAMNLSLAEGIKNNDRELKNGSLKIPREIETPEDYYGELKNIPWVVHS
jgi:hypothetical protein